MTKIENMIDLRLRCVELALEFYKDSKNCDTGHLKHCAKNFESYILGDSELPKVPIDTNKLLLDFISKNNNEKEQAFEEPKYYEGELKKMREMLANSKQG